MKNPITSLKNRHTAWRMRRTYQHHVAHLPATAPDITPADWPQSLRDPTEFYLRCVHYFHRRLPDWARAHRAYFSSEGRGFGEDAFHTLWFLLFQAHQPSSFLEIGVFRGQTLSYTALLARHHQRACRVCGVSPFSPAGDSVSRYKQHTDYWTDTLANFAHFKLPPPELVKAYSTDSTAVDFISGSTWDLIYIDGNHDYEVALHDWNVCARSVRAGGLIVLDDAGLSTSYRPPIFATGGHPGPSRLAAEIDPALFEEILQVGHNRVFRKRPATA